MATTPYINFVGALNIVEDIQRAATDGVAGAANGVQALAAALAAQVGNRADLQKAHERVGRRMIAATLEAYDQNVEGRKKTEQRASPDRNKGKLRPALQSSKMVNATAGGIQFVNIAVLRGRARHYRRLNFGAQGKGVGSDRSPTIPFSLFGTHLRGLSFNQSARPAFQLPPGLFLEGGHYSFPGKKGPGTGVFIPLGELPRGSLTGRVAARARLGKFDKITRGIQPRYFLEAGLRQFAEAIPQEYDLLMQGWLAKGNKAGQAYLSNLKIRGGTGRLTNFANPKLRVTA
jgi:hypothetical protein